MEAGGEGEFVDYYYTLGVSLDASTNLIEARYWSLARQYRANAALSARIDELNEARRVLTSRRLRREYDERRAAVLGPDAPSQPPEPEKEPPPLRVMEKLLPELHDPEPPSPDLPGHGPGPEPRWLRARTFVVLGLAVSLLAVCTLVLWLTGVVP